MLLAINILWSQNESLLQKLEDVHERLHLEIGAKSICQWFAQNKINLYGLYDINIKIEIKYRYSI